MDSLRPGDIYIHFKGKKYQIVTVATHSESGEKLVIYQALYDDFSVYARPLEMFLSEVDHDKYPDVTQKYRFEKLIKEENSTDIKEPKKEEPRIEEVKAEEMEVKEGEVNPYLLDFLNADTYKEKLEVLSAAKGKVDERVLDNMAVSLDFVLPEGSDEIKLNALIKCIRTYEKYELRRR